MCEISCKNFKRLLRKRQETLGDTFFPHTAVHRIGVYGYGCGWEISNQSIRQLKRLKSRANQRRILSKVHVQGGPKNWTIFEC